MQKIPPFLWFDGQAEEAVNSYTPYLKIPRSSASCAMAMPDRVRKEQRQIRRDVVLGEMLQDKDAKKSTRVMNAMMQTNKLDMGGLKRAYEQQ